VRYRDRRRFRRLHHECSKLNSELLAARLHIVGLNSQLETAFQTEQALTTRLRIAVLIRGRDMTAEEFEALTGEPPERDDLGRVNCKTAGELWHQGCGLCPMCGLPKFMCDHEKE